jgi:hypothetical protein
MREEITTLREITSCEYKPHSACKITLFACGNRTLRVEINIVRVEIRLVRVGITFVPVEITLCVEITICV